jgi:membrane-bound lytic murein transglycosylase F
MMLSAVSVACPPSEQRFGDLAEMHNKGELRVVLRPGFFGPDRAVEVSTEEAVLIRRFAARLGLSVRWIEAARHDHLLDMVRGGKADLAVSRFAPADLLDSGLRASATVDWVDDLLLANGANDGREVEESRNADVHVHRSAATPRVLKFLAERGLRAVDVPEEVSLEEILRRVESGRYPMTVSDSRIARAVGATERLQIVEKLGPRRSVVWAVRQRNPQLRLAADRFLFAERVLFRSSRTAACRDLDRISQARVLRLITRNSATTCAVTHGDLSGFEYDLALEFARRLGLRLELSIPPPETDPLDYLRQGYGDLAALHEPIAPADEGSLLVSEAYRRVDLVAVVSSRAEMPTSVEELAGVRAAASRPVAELARLVPLFAPVRARPPAIGADAFNAIIEVARGKVPVAIVDRDAARLELEDLSDLEIGPVVLPDAALVWVMNVSSPRLLGEANRFLREARNSGLVRQLVHNQFGSTPPLGTAGLLPIPEGALSPYDELLRWAGHVHGIDWRLLGSLMYEESRFDPEAVGPGGSAGLFQFMPFTWRELGVEDPHDPHEATEAAGRYLRRLMDEFAELPLPDRVAIALASYNVGPGHLHDARRLAHEMGLDPDRWLGSVETAMLVLDDPDVARRFSTGVCRCRRAVGYTRRILRRYAAYTEQFPPA